MAARSQRGGTQGQRFATLHECSLTEGVAYLHLSLARFRQRSRRAHAVVEHWSARRVRANHR